jgi:polyketide cyclase/dehydrase/lipid transport protein
MRLRVTIRVDRPPEDVFRFVATNHYANHPRWDGQVEEIEPLTPGPIAVGARARVRRRRGSPDEVLEVTAYSPPRHFATRDNIGPFLLEMDADFESLGENATLLTLTADTSAKGPVRLALPVLRPIFRRQMRKSAVAIRSMVEAESGQVVPLPL